MIISICGSLKFYEEMLKVKLELEKMGFQVFVPIKASGVDYWSEDNRSRVEAKKNFEFISEYLDKIELSEAILVTNFNKNEIANYIGANTLIEMGFAHYRKKRIYLLNPLPDQKYIIDELLTINPIILYGNLSKIND